MRLSFLALALAVSVSTATAAANGNLRTGTDYQTEAPESTLKAVEEEIIEIEQQIIADNAGFLRRNIADRALLVDNATPVASMNEIIASQRW